MLYMSKLQYDALRSIEEIRNVFGTDRPFTQWELPGVTKNTTNALVNKGFLDLVDGPFGDSGPEYFVRTDKQVE